jgi:hypothetical protein
MFKALIVEIGNTVKSSEANSVFPVRFQINDNCVVDVPFTLYICVTVYSQ